MHMTIGSRGAFLVAGLLLLAGLMAWAGGSTETATTAKAAVAAGPFGKYDPPISITSVRQQLGPTTKYSDGDSFTNNVWTRAYKDELGINLSYLWVVDSSQWQQKSNLMIASGDLPDYFQASNIQFQQLRDADLVADLTSAFKSYVWDYTNGVLNEGGPKPLESATFGGKLMGIPFTGLPREGVNILFVRTDWLAKLGLKEPKTLGDVVAIARAFKTRDPDGNGKDDTIGLPIDKFVWGWTNGIFNGYHAYPTAWVKDSSGKLAYGGIQPEAKAALAQLQQLYKEGLIDQDFVVKDNAKASEALTGGKAGLFYGYFWSPLSPLQPGRDKDPNYQWKGYPIMSIDEKVAKNQVNLGVYGYWVVKKGYKNPEAVVKLMNLWMKYFYQNTSDEIYKKYVNWDDGNEVWQNATAMGYRAFKNLAGLYNNNDVIKGTKKITDITPEERGVQEKIQRYLKGDQAMWCWDRIYGLEGALWAVDTYKKTDAYMTDEFYGPPTATMTERWSTLGDKMIEVYTKLIMGALPMSDFDVFVADWKKLGGDQITKEVNDWYAKQK